MRISCWCKWFSLSVWWWLHEIFLLSILRLREFIRMSKRWTHISINWVADVSVHHTVQLDCKKFNLKHQSYSILIAINFNDYRSRELVGIILWMDKIFRWDISGGYANLKRLDICALMIIYESASSWTATASLSRFVA